MEKHFSFMMIIAWIIFLMIISMGIMSVFAQTLTWEYDTNVPDLAGFYLYENDTNIPEKSISKVKAIIDPNKRIYKLKAIPEGQYYYYLTAFDLSGNESETSNVLGVLVDRTPPPGVGDTLRRKTITETITEIKETVTTYE